MRNIFHAKKDEWAPPFRFGELSPGAPTTKRICIYFALGLLIVFAFLTANGARPANAQSGGGYDLTWNTFDGGGAMFSTGGNYSLGGTIGQADAGTMSGGSYILSGGFWVDFLGNKINLPLIMR